MKLGKVLKELIKEETKEFIEDNKILFNWGNQLYYRDINQRKEDAIKLKQIPSILASGWWIAEWESYNPSEVFPYLVKYKHKSGEGMGFAKTLGTAKHDAQLLKGKVIRKKDNKELADYT